MEGNQKGVSNWTTTYNRSFELQRSSPTPDQLPSPSKTPYPSSPSPVGKRHQKPQDLGIFVLPGKSCELKTMGVKQDVGRVKRNKTPLKKVMMSLQTKDIEGAQPKIRFPPISNPPRPRSALRQLQDSPDLSLISKSPNPLAGLGLMEQLQVPKKPVQAPRQRYRVIPERGRRLLFCGTMEVTSKVGDYRTASL